MESVKVLYTLVSKKNESQADRRWGNVLQSEQQQSDRTDTSQTQNVGQFD